MGDGKREWSNELAVKLLNSVVVGITRRSVSGETLEQFYGKVDRADAQGIALTLSGSRSGEILFLPPDPSAFFPAKPGSYRLRDTGEVVDNPDFTTTWTVDPDED